MYTTWKARAAYLPSAIARRASHDRLSFAQKMVAAEALAKAKRR
jgi:hypothetical protein